MSLQVLQILRNNTSSPLVLFSDGVRIAAMAKNCHNDYKMKFSLDEEFPDLSLHNNHMSKVHILKTKMFSFVAFGSKIFSECHTAQVKRQRMSCDCIITNLHWVPSAVGADQGDLR